ncbi:farnesyltranstransferase NDAI_0E02850 [Naumovozyma dairenensis CBS 421]|uniref:Geranylgeranyl pyrophosphate synthase n=1 Tax=Naumovozyma dairenensis (strain ATCC 10597 / BCRC 20456 / CBS 421 / NBRC 0211 / NRRL Y-12639) TaxID=1071378 RepID=G0WBI2_NAUDC|nr:hypothetical protein NDAI_0E02850 [Naumovozyma dairenensis CBS 421]CCD25102.1 hypothetical protein NDAI_0E02850 [Naumovozyma dairenensis CBS 421]
MTSNDNINNNSSTMNEINSMICNTPQWSIEDEDTIARPYKHITLHQGKRFRSKLIQTFNKIYEIPNEQLQILMEIIETLHNSSLIIDDIEDNSDLRRGNPSSHVVFGMPMSLNTANYMYFKSMNLIWKMSADQTSILELLQIFNEELMNLHRGQGLDIHWRDSLNELRYDGVPNEQMYFKMVMNKTGGLFRLTIRMMEKISPNFNRKKKTLVPLGNLLGIIYQIRDDYQNLVNNTMIANKGFAEDLSEGKLSFPIIHGLRFESLNNVSGPTLLNILLKRTDDDELKKVALKFLQDTSKSIEYTRKVIEDLVRLIKNSEFLPSLDDVNGNEDAINEINFIIDHISNI